MMRHKSLTSNCSVTNIMLMILFTFSVACGFNPLASTPLKDAPFGTRELKLNKKTVTEYWYPTVKTEGELIEYLKDHPAKTFNYRKYFEFNKEIDNLRPRTGMYRREEDEFNKVENDRKIAELMNSIENDHYFLVNAFSCLTVHSGRRYDFDSDNNSITYRFKPVLRESTGALDMPTLGKLYLKSRATYRSMADTKNRLFENVELVDHPELESEFMFANPDQAAQFVAENKKHPNETKIVYYFRLSYIDDEPDFCNTDRYPYMIISGIDYEIPDSASYERVKTTIAREP